MDSIVANIRNILERGGSVTDYLNCLIITPFYGNMVHLVNEFRTSSFAPCGIIPKIMSFEEIGGGAPNDMLFFINTLDKVCSLKSLSFSANLQITENIIKTLKVCKKYSDSVPKIPFSRTLHSTVSQQAWNIIEEDWDVYTGIWEGLRSLQEKKRQNKGFKLFFIDTIPQCHFPCLDDFRSFLREENGCFIFEYPTFPQKNNNFFFREFCSPTEEAIAVATITEKLSIKSPPPKIAIISDDDFLLAKIKSELNLLQIKNQLITTDFYGNTVDGAFISDFCDFLGDPGCATLGQLLCNQAVQNAASNEFKKHANTFLSQILRTPSEIIDSRLIVKQEASLDEILLITKYYDKFAPLTKWVQEFIDLSKTPEDGTISQFLAIHKEAMLRFWEMVGAVQPLPNFFGEIEQYSVEYVVSWEEYVNFIKSVLLRQNHNTATKLYFPFEIHSDDCILLLPTKSALYYDYDIVILPSMEENSWYQQETFGKMLAVNDAFQLSTELDTFNYIATRCSAVYMTCSTKNTNVRHRFLDNIKTQEIEEIFEKSDVCRSIMPQQGAVANAPLPLCPTSFSVTDLQLFSDDPYGFYAKKVLRLSPIVCFYTAADFGRWAHHILDQYFKQGCLARGIGLVSFAQELSVKSKSSHKLFLRLLPTFASFEKEFGEIKEKNINVFTEQKVQMTFEINGISMDFHGVIDRVDALPDNEFYIVDYKTGALPTKSEIQHCAKVQLPLEAKMFKSGSGASISVRAIKLKTEIGKSNEVILPITTELLAELNNRMLQLFEQYHGESFLFETTVANKARRPEYAHLSRIRLFS